MTILPVAPPQRVAGIGNFDYVTVDALRRRVYAAHTGARALVIVNADTGAVLANIPVGRAHGVAYDPLGGHAFVGTSEGIVREIDPDAKAVLRSVDVGGQVDAIAYDSVLGRIYADEDDGTKLWVIDARSFKVIATVLLPGHKPEYLAVDPVTHDVYQNIADLAEIAVVDPDTFAVRETFKTPELISNHPLQFDPAFGQIVSAGSNGVMSAYDRAGHKMGQANVPRGIDQCDLDAGTHLMACAHNGTMTMVQLTQNAAPRVVDEALVAPGLHTIAIDAKTHDVWTAWSTQDGSGDFVRRYTVKTPPETVGSLHSSRYVDTPNKSSSFAAANFRSGPLE